MYTTVVVPDFAREPLSLSGLAVGRVEGHPIGGRAALNDVLPFAPTTVRTFASTDRVGALLRVYQAGRSMADATVTTEILNIADEVVVSATRTIPAAHFQSGVGVDHPYELPLKQLSAGDYLLRVTVTAGKQTAHRDVRFTVPQSSPEPRSTTSADNCRSTSACRLCAPAARCWDEDARDNRCKSR